MKKNSTLKSETRLSNAERRQMFEKMRGELGIKARGANQSMTTCIQTYDVRKYPL